MSEKESTGTRNKERNMQLVLEYHFSFVYIPGSQVYHSAFCPHALRSKKTLCNYSPNLYSGKPLRPCKFCEAMIAKQQAAFSKKKKKSKKKDDQDPNAIVHVRLIDGAYVGMYRKNIVGCCHCATHPGKLTKHLMLEHNCVQKGCWYFEKYDCASYWRGKQLRKQAKEKTREQQRKAKETEKLQEERLNGIQQEMQNVIDALSYPMEIIRLEQVEAKWYKIFYVSDYPFADGNRFPDFLGAIYTAHPGWRLWLQHIKDMEGRFVTRSMYHAVKR